MPYPTHDELIGKTIASFRIGHEHLAIVFTDKTHVVFKFGTFYESPECDEVNKNDLDPLEQFHLGLMAETEAEELNRKREQKRKARHEACDRETLKRLKAKYE